MRGSVWTKEVSEATMKKPARKLRTDPRVDAHIEAAAPFAKPILRRLRVLIHAEAPDVEETIKWRVPSFLLDGQILCGMAAFKAHCVFGFWHTQMNAELPGGDANPMSAFGRLTSVQDLPSDREMRRLIRRAAEIQASGAPARPREKKAPKAALPVPKDLAAGMGKNRAAKATFEKLPPSGRRDYIEWIIGAKREETRQKRLATALEWLAEGKPRNWKYENC
jgi:uncharacterized protein YdeI (YjbR/CyaY-like superfamily)